MVHIAFPDRPILPLPTTLPACDAPHIPITLNTLCTKQLPCHKRFVRVVLATPSGSVRHPLPRTLTIRQAIDEMLCVLCEVQETKLDEEGRRCVPVEKFLMDKLHDYVVYIGLVPLHPPFGGSSGYRSRAMVALKSAVGTILPRVIRHIICLYIATTPCSQEQDLHDTVTHALDVTLDDSETDGVVFISMAFTTAQLYRAYGSICPIDFMVAGIQRKVHTMKATDDYIDPKYVFANLAMQYSNSGAHLYVGEHCYLRAPLCLVLYVGAHAVHFFECGTMGRFLLQMPSVDQVFEQALSCYTAFLLSKGIDPTTIAKKKAWTGAVPNVNPLRSSTPDTMTRHIPVELQRRARLLFYMNVPDIGVALLPANVTSGTSTLRAHVHREIARCLFRTIKQSDAMLLNSQIALLMVNQYFLILRNLVEARHEAIEAAVIQLRILTASEADSDRFSSPLPAIDLTSVPMCHPTMSDIQRLVWLERLLNLSQIQATHLVGNIEIVLSEFYFRTEIPVNHGTTPYSSVESRLVSKMLPSATDLPAIVHMHEDAKVVPLKLDQSVFWHRFPFDYRSFNGDPHQVATVMNLPLCVAVGSFPSFFTGDTLVHPTRPHSLENFPLTVQTDSSDAALYRLLEAYFHHAATETVTLAMERLEGAVSTGAPITHTSFKLRLPRLWGRGANHTSFCMMPDRNSVATLLASWRCIPITDRIPHDILLEGDSVFKQVYNALPCCPGGKFYPIGKTVDLEPIELPTVIPAPVLQLALDCRTIECKCLDCRSIYRRRAWSTGSHITIEHCPDLRLACYNDADGPRVRPITTNDFDKSRWVQNILRCLTPQAQNYILDSRFNTSGSLRPLLAKFCNIIYDNTADICSPVTGDAIPLHPYEYRYIDTLLRFICHRPADKLGERKAEVQERTEEKEECATGRKRKHGR